MPLNAGSFDLGAKGKRIENPSDWTESEILRKGGLIQSDKGPDGDFDD